MSYKKPSGVALSLGLLAALISAPISATPMTYTYSSGALSPSNASGIPAVTYISLTFTADLAASLTGDSSIAALSDWAISDGFNSESSASGGWRVVTFNVQTDIDAIITNFNFNAIVDPFNNTIADPILVGANFQMVITNGDLYGNAALTNYCTSAADDGTCTGATGATSTDTRGGVSTAVPAPATLALFGLGLAGLGISRRKRPTHS